MKQLIVLVLIILAITYLTCVTLCTIEHNKKLNKIPSWNPCASCWALNLGDK